MNIHEYQAKLLFRQNGVPVPDGYLAHNPTEAEFAVRRLGSEVAVVKAQVHAGGRGKAGGVKLAKTPEEARNITEQMIGHKLGEFAPTRTFKSHMKSDKKAKRR